ncbi:MAG: lysophospholipid acyltransferase family protein [Desulfoplanes sp.]|nr:lysophospholipid acyltransferase family protein [Desulfoplanes sp.]
MSQNRSWSSRSIGSRLQHHIFYTLIRFGGRNAAYVLLFFVVLWYTIRPSIRARSTAYISRRFPRATGREQFFHCFHLQMELGKTLVDRATAGILRAFEITGRAEDDDTLIRLHAEGNGVILLSGHVGCWQMAAMGLTVVNAPVHVLLLREQGDVDRHYFEHRSQKIPVSIIDPLGYLGGTLEMMAALAKGDLLCTMGDRVLGNDTNTVAVPFMGGTIRVPVSPYRLASATGAPIVVTFALRTGPGRARHEIAKIIRVPQGLGKQHAAYLPYALEFAAALEGITRKAPYQFFNFYDLWEKQRK